MRTLPLRYAGDRDSRKKNGFAARGGLRRSFGRRGLVFGGKKGSAWGACAVDEGALPLVKWDGRRTHTRELAESSFFTSPWRLGGLRRPPLL